MAINNYNLSFDVPVLFTQNSVRLEFQYPVKDETSTSRSIK
jgi:hypothetical protein